MEQQKKKKIVSNILLEKRDWKNAIVEKPEPGQQVVMRLVNPTMICGENDKEVYPYEDVKIGVFVRDYNDPTKGSWSVSPPYPLFDYSPLSTKDQLAEGTIVSHWAIPEEGEIEGWNTRFDQVNVFKHLILEVDDDHKEDVYRALLWGAAFIQKCNPNDADATRLATILYDLQYVLDNGKGIDLTDEEYEQKLEELKAKIETAEREAKEKQAARVDRVVSTIMEPEDKGAESQP